MHGKEADSKMWQLSREQISRQIIGRQLYLQQNISRLKKKGPGQIRNQDLCRPRNIRYFQVKLTGNAYKFEFIMNQDTSNSSDSVI